MWYLIGYTRGHVSSVCTLVLSCVRFLRLVYFQAAEFRFFYGFSNIPRVPALLCDHGVLRLRGNVRTTTTKIWISPTTCRARTRPAACQWFAASPANPHDSSDLPRFLPAGLTPYVLNHTSKSAPYHVTEDDVTASIDRLEVQKIISHRSVRGRGGVVAVL